MLTSLELNVTFPFVPSINLDQFMTGNGENDWMVRSTLFGILEKSPKLQNLKVELFYWGEPISYFKDLFFESLERKDNANLKHLQISIQGLTDSDFSRLIALGLRLRSLILYFEYVQDDRSKWRNECRFIDFLRCQSETLVHLELRGLRGVFDRFQFPLLKKIETLTINWWRPLSRDFQPSPSINYEQLPTLKKLEIKDWDNRWMQFLPDASYTPVQAVENLKLDLQTNPISEELEIYVLHAAQYFPNLKVLGDIPVNVRIANSIYKWLPRLEELTFIVGPTRSIDDIITGLSLEICAALRLLPISEIRKLSVEKNEKDLDADSLRPLSSLTHLKILRLKETGPGRYNRTAEFMRLSTLLVLTKMPSLKRIDFGWRAPAYMYTDMDDEIQDLKDSGKSVLYIL